MSLTPSLAYLKHPIHYYEAGNFIFIVEKYVFRVLGSLIARQSPVFKDMLSMPQILDPGSHQEAQGMIHGVPAVTLSDSADHFAQFLDLIFPPKTPRSGTLTLGSLLGLAQICLKYDFQDIFEWTVSELKLGLPTALDTLDQLSVYHNPQVAIDVIWECRHPELSQFPPLAFYSLATIELAQVEEEIAVAAMSSLRIEDQLHLSRGRSALLREVLSKSFDMPENSPSPPMCIWMANDDPCQMGRVPPGIWIDPKERQSELLLHPLEELGRRMEYEYTCLCESCKTGVLSRNAALQGELLQFHPPPLLLIEL